MKSRQFPAGHRHPRDIAALGRQQASQQQRWRNAFISVCVVGAAIYALVSPIAG